MAVCLQERAGWCGPDARQVYCITHMVTWYMWDTDGVSFIVTASEVLAWKVQPTGFKGNQA